MVIADAVRSPLGPAGPGAPSPDDPGVLPQPSRRRRSSSGSDELAAVAVLMAGGPGFDNLARQAQLLDHRACRRRPVMPQHRIHRPDRCTGHRSSRRRPGARDGRPGLNHHCSPRAVSVRPNCWRPGGGSTGRASTPMPGSPGTGPARSRWASSA
ncbi:hypothetical protein HBB16_01785 [Pseudonocardia sp. MCCB 268]|nr:hypothetical protein [Pseudonocardia cytotoxica]